MSGGPIVFKGTDVVFTINQDHGKAKPDLNAIAKEVDRNRQAFAHLAAKFALSMPHPEDVSYIVESPPATKADEDLLTRSLAVALDKMRDERDAAIRTHEDLARTIGGVAARCLSPYAYSQAPNAIDRLEALEKEIGRLRAVTETAKVAADLATFRTELQRELGETAKLVEGPRNLGPPVPPPRGELFHTAISTDIDRFHDGKLETDYLSDFERDYGVTTTHALRLLCRNMKGRGFHVFPPCGNVGPDGRCLGHPIERAAP